MMTELTLHIDSIEDRVGVRLKNLGRVVGVLDAVAEPRSAVRIRCEDDMIYVLSACGAKSHYMWRVVRSFLVPRLQGTGVGWRMYAELARYVSEEYGSIIGSDACFGGDTSAEADRVWKSKGAYPVVQRGGFMGWVK